MMRGAGETTAVDPALIKRVENTLEPRQLPSQLTITYIKIDAHTDQPFELDMGSGKGTLMSKSGRGHRRGEGGDTADNGGVGDGDGENESAGDTTHRSDDSTTAGGEGGAHHQHGSNNNNSSGGGAYEPNSSSGEGGPALGGGGAYSQVHVSSKSLKIKVDYKPHWTGTVGQQPEGLNKVMVTLLVSRKPLTRPSDAVYQEAIPLSRCGETLLCFGEYTGTLYCWLFPSQTIADVKITFLIGHAVSPSEDVTHPWRISKMYNVDPDVFDDMLEWLQRNKADLKSKYIRLVKDQLVDGSERATNPLHTLMSNCGDPKLAQFFITNCFRYINPEQQDHLQQTPLMKLLQRKDIGSNSPYYSRALQLTELVAKKAALPCDQQDHLGNTALHYAARSHRHDSSLFSVLVTSGAATQIRNHAGRTPLEEASLEEYGLLPSDKADIEKLVSKNYNPAKRTLKFMDHIPAPYRVRRALEEATAAAEEEARLAEQERQFRSRFGSRRESHALVVPGSPVVLPPLLRGIDTCHGEGAGGNRNPEMSQVLLQSRQTEMNETAGYVSRPKKTTFPPEGLPKLNDLLLAEKKKATLSSLADDKISANGSIAKKEQAQLASLKGKLDRLILQDTTISEGHQRKVRAVEEAKLVAQKEKEDAARQEIEEVERTLREAKQRRQLQNEANPFVEKKHSVVATTDVSDAKKELQRLEREQASEEARREKERQRIEDEKVAEERRAQAAAQAEKLREEAERNGSQHQLLGIVTPQQNGGGDFFDPDLSSGGSQHSQSTSTPNGSRSRSQLMNVLTNASAPLSSPTGGGGSPYRSQRRSHQNQSFGPAGAGDSLGLSGFQRWLGGESVRSVQSPMNASRTSTSATTVLDPPGGVRRGGGAGGSFTDTPQSGHLAKKMTVVEKQRLKHAKDLEVARAQNQAQKEYEAKYEDMRSQLRAQILRETFGDETAMKIERSSAPTGGHDGKKSPKRAEEVSPQSHRGDESFVANDQSTPTVSGVGGGNRRRSTKPFAGGTSPNRRTPSRVASVDEQNSQLRGRGLVLVKHTDPTSSSSPTSATDSERVVETTGRQQQVKQVKKNEGISIICYDSSKDQLSSDRRRSTSSSTVTPTKGMHPSAVTTGSGGEDISVSLHDIDEFEEFVDWLDPAFDHLVGPMSDDSLLLQGGSHSCLLDLLQEKSAGARTKPKAPGTVSYNPTCDITLDDLAYRTKHEILAEMENSPLIVQ